MVRPAQGVQEGGGAVRHAGAGQLLAHVQEVFHLGACDGVHHLGGVALHMLFQQVQHTAGILQRVVLQGMAFSISLVGPTGLIVDFFVFVVTAKQAFFKVVVLPHDQTCIGVSFDVFVLDFVVLQ